MKFDVITLFPEMFSAIQYGVVGRALTQKLIDVQYWNPRDFASNKHKSVDDRPYGGGPGMVMAYQPLHEALAAAKKADSTPAKTIYLSAQGKPLTHAAVAELSQLPRLILISGRYEGVDQRFIDLEVDEEYSIGDYVLSGGELPTMVMIDAIARLLPGVLGHDQSAENDSFVSGLLDYPHYTRPEEIAGISVPKVLLSGDHEAIARWRLKESLGNTWQKRRDLLKRRILSSEEQRLLDEYIEESMRNSHE